MSYHHNLNQVDWFFKETSETTETPAGNTETPTNGNTGIVPTATPETNPTSVPVSTETMTATVTVTPKSTSNWGIWAGIVVLGITAFLIYKYYR